MDEMFESVKSKAVSALKTVKTRRELMELKTTFLGKSGEITGLMKNMKNLAPEERSSFGKFVNALKQEVEEMFSVGEKGK